jgi:uncharacterized membrane protein YuzA (DUF378 family)
MSKTQTVRIRILLSSIVFFGALNYGALAMNYNLIDGLSTRTNNIIGKNLYLSSIIYIILALAGLYLASDRTTWLPFLGDTVLPGSLIPLKQNTNKSGQQTIITVQVKPNSRVAYWASLPTDTNADTNIPWVEQAYADYSNSGVILADRNGHANLLVTIGSDYTVPGNKIIERHVHYRELDQQYGMIGPVHTTYY